MLTSLLRFLGAAVSRYEFQKAHQFRPYPLSAVRDIIRQSIEALEYVHSLELVHTDIKPENICLVSGQPRKPGAPLSTKIRLIDFGTAEWCASDGYRNALVSTRQYRAPEVVMGLGWNHVIDMWAIGCVVIEMLAGRCNDASDARVPSFVQNAYKSNVAPLRLLLALLTVDEFQDARFSRR